MVFKKGILLCILLGLNVLISLSQTNNFEEAVKYKNLALSQLDEKKFSQAEENILKAMVFSSKANSWQLDGDCMTMAAIIYEKQNQINKTLQYYLRAVSVYEKNNAFENLSAIYSQIGFIYYDIEAYAKASDYFVKSDVVNNKADSNKLTVIEKIGVE